MSPPTPSPPLPPSRSGPLLTWNSHAFGHDFHVFRFDFHLSRENFRVFACHFHLSREDFHPFRLNYQALTPHFRVSRFHFHASSFDFHPSDIGFPLPLLALLIARWRIRRNRRHAEWCMRPVAGSSRKQNLSRGNHPERLCAVPIARLPGSGGSGAGSRAGSSEG